MNTRIYIRFIFIFVLALKLFSILVLNALDTLEAITMIYTKTSL